MTSRKSYIQKSRKSEAQNYPFLTGNTKTANNTKTAVSPRFLGYAPFTVTASQEARVVDERPAADNAVTRFRPIVSRFRTVIAIIIQTPFPYITCHIRKPESVSAFSSVIIYRSDKIISIVPLSHRTRPVLITNIRSAFRL